MMSPHRDIVLVVEDDESIAELERRHLERDGFEVLIAQSGRQALGLIDGGNHHPSLLILDYRLPDTSGVELMQRVRDAGLDIPAVIVTAAGNEEVAVSALKLGAMDYIVKDRETIKALPATCREVLRRFNLERENARLIEQMRTLNLELTESNRKLDDISKRDELTGIFNRRYLMESLGHEAARSERYGAPLSFVLFDLDFFKHINDTYGHTAGDLVLKQFAAAVSGRLRKTDIFGRYGGEEFVAVLTDTPLDKAAAIAEDIRSMIEGHTFGYEHTPLRLTVSAGVAGMVAGMKMEDLVELSDRGLYQAKNSGRNRVVAHQRGESPEY